MDGERIYDKKGEGNVFPDLGRVRKMLAHVREKIAEAGPGGRRRRLAGRQDGSRNGPDRVFKPLR